MTSLNRLSCLECDFELFNPVGVLDVSFVGLYDDGRFPGRLIVSIQEHYEDFDFLEQDLMIAFVEDVRLASQVVKDITGVERVNLAILGNTVPHVHAHLIPRYPEQESLPGKSPWNDPRPLQVLPQEDKKLLVEKFITTFELLNS